MAYTLTYVAFVLFTVWYCTKQLPDQEGTQGIVVLMAVLIVNTAALGFGLGNHLAEKRWAEGCETVRGTVVCAPPGGLAGAGSPGPVHRFD